MKEVTIQSTTDYSLFSDITSNREVDKRHVNTLKRAIQEVNLLHLNPLIVTSSMQIIDGQHRLEAARSLELPVYYIVDDQVSKKNIAGINSNQKHWSMLDYVNYFAVEKVPEYLVLSEFICTYPNIPISTLLQLLSSTGSRDRDGFKNGKIDVQNKDHARVVLEYVQSIRNVGIELAYDRQFILAIKDAFLVEEFNADHFLDRLKEYRAELYKCAKKIQYLQIIESIYNKYQHKKIRLY